MREMGVQSLGWGRAPGVGHGNPLYFCLENPMDRGAWWATVHGVTKNQSQLSDWANTLLRQWWFQRGCVWPNIYICNSWHLLSSHFWPIRSLPQRNLTFWLLTVFTQASGLYARNSRCLSDPYPPVTHDSFFKAKHFFVSNITCVTVNYNSLHTILTTCWPQYS